ncbi:YihY/virulence factor BrkB family protein [Kytococcus sedentarius]|uniref:YihY/virulence factor BrkB family protein n=1 Tax=Kytococcus sedentarius TaxID=1276 RepID=UPI00194E425E|nr:YihY/virulence factor BrkB family protein [Kytococcus sedentarius]QRO88399.1 YihY/virulence factor BrkB family protein [Kytococcus sedentarius]
MSPSTAADHADPPSASRSGGRKVLGALVRARLVRAGRRYLLAHGNVYAGGVTLSALISLVAALTLAVTAFRMVLGRRPELFDRVVDAVNGTFPGLLGDGEAPGVLTASDLVIDGGLTLATLVSLPVLLWTATNAMTYLRMSVRAMFGLAAAPLHPVRAKLWDLVGILLLSSSVVVTAMLSSAATSAARFVLDRAHIDAGTDLTLRIAALAAAFVVDAVTIALLFRVAAKVRTPWAQRWRGAVLGALGWGVLRVAGTSLIGAWANPLVVSFAGLVTLIVWINLAVRWVLFTAAWTADPPAPQFAQAEDVHAREIPNYVTLAAPHTLLWPHHRVTGAIIGEQEAAPGAPPQAEG